MSSRLFLALFLVTLAGCCCSANYNYKCLPAEALSVPVRQFRRSQMKSRMPGCAQRRHYCNTVSLLYTDWRTPGSDAYLVVANWRACESYRAHIVDALNNEDTKIGYMKFEVNCAGVTVGQVTTWLARGYVYRALVQCLDNLCTRADRLEPWQIDERTSCKRYLNE